MHVGRVIYKALRNGLAHGYGPNPIIVGNSRVQLVMSWKRGFHLRVVGLRREGGQNWFVPVEQSELPGTFVCVKAEALHRDLVSLFDDRVSKRLLLDAGYARTVDTNARRVQRGEEPKRPDHTTWEQWERFLRDATLTESAAAQTGEEEE